MNRAGIHLLCSARNSCFCWVSTSGIIYKSGHRKGSEEGVVSVRFEPFCEANMVAAMLQKPTSHYRDQGTHGWLSLCPGPFFYKQKMQSVKESLLRAFCEAEATSESCWAVGQPGSPLVMGTETGCCNVLRSWLGWRVVPSFLKQN